MPSPFATVPLSYRSSFLPYPPYRTSDPVRDHAHNVGRRRVAEEVRDHRLDGRRCRASIGHDHVLKLFYSLAHPFPISFTTDVTLNLLMLFKHSHYSPRSPTEIEEEIFTHPFRVSPSIYLTTSIEALIPSWDSTE